MEQQGERIEHYKNIYLRMKQGPGLMCFLLLDLRKCCGCYVSGDQVGNQLLTHKTKDIFSHNVPLKPIGQVQLKEATRSTHSPPLRQGEDQHSSQSVSQCSPVKPSSQ